MVRISVDLPADLADALEARCRRIGNSRNAEVNLAIRAYLEPASSAEATTSRPPQTLTRPAARAASPWRRGRHVLPAQHALRSREG